MSSIVRYRADDYAERMTFKSGGQPIDIVGWTFLMTVNRRENPVDTSDQLFQSVGEIVAPSTNGQADFPIAGTTDPGEYFFDVEIHDALGKRKTPKKGNFIVLQDITKGDGAVVIEGSGLYPLGGEYTDFEIGIGNSAGHSLTYGERDGRNTLVGVGNEAAGDSLALVLGRPKPIFDFTDHAWEITTLHYVRNAYIQIGLVGVTGRMAPSAAALLNVPGSSTTEYSWVSCLNHNVAWTSYFSAFLNTVTTAGWWWSKVKLDQAAKTMYAKHWKDGDTEPDWATQATYGELLPTRMVAWTALRSVDQGDHDWELAEFQWSRV